MHLITGGSGSGKSAFAEDLAVQAGKKRLYLATMEPFGEEGRERVRKHRKMRAGKGFETLEWYRDLDRLELEGNDRVILLECMTNLVANELFEGGGTDEEICSRVEKGIRHLQNHCQDLMIVTSQFVSDGLDYEPETLRYIRLLGRVNRLLAEAADQVTEVACGIPVPVKPVGIQAGQ